MTTNSKRRDAQKPITTGSRLRNKLTHIFDTNDRLSGGGMPTADLLRLLKKQRDLVNEALDLGILLSRQKGFTWREIGDTLDISAQAIEQRMRRLSTHVDNGELTA